ncbi:acyl-CoA thioesterase [Polaribacter batillariae]|uniref:Acyl-CoA thioesterase n=1 Tax=Polaribacter batillariae TaxID=2808900 RepID=A0ABX7SWZ1_9FLAO|nr:thioesterase family protein [Polaribacter batillariae]QTD38016.1 acyl-CoA thioesterase [Polaribacter batillariae]
MKSVFEFKFKVKSEDLDDLNHVNNVVYVKWMDTVAFEHWTFLTKEDPLKQYIWVVLKHEIEYLKQAVLGDKITVKTWVGETRGFKSERLMEFYKNDELLVKAKTVWGMLDKKTYKPARIREDVLAVLYPDK